MIKEASVKVMLSYDYSHFEVSMSVCAEEGVLTLKDIDEARKDCQRLADKAVSQYKTAKQFAANRTDSKYKMENFENQCKSILLKNKGDRTINEIAMLKQYETENWQAQFESRYDYEDNDDTHIF